MWTALFIGVCVLIVIGVASRKQEVGRPKMIDGYLVHIRIVPSPNHPELGPDAHIEVELGANDLSVEPDFVVQRRGIKVPMSYDLLRGTLHQRLVMSTDIDLAAHEMVTYARALRVASEETREELLDGVLRSNRETRLKCLLDLIRQFPRSNETHRAATASMVDDHPPIRMHAAILLEDEGLEIVEHLVADEDTPIDLRLLGLRHRSRAVDRTRYAALIDQLLESPSIEMRAAAIYAYADLEGENALDRLIAVLDGAPPEIAETIARAFGRIRSPRAEPALLALLDSKAEEVLIAAAQALSRVGSTAAVSSLVQVLYNRTPLEEMTKLVLQAAIDVLKDDRRPNTGGHLSMVGATAETRGGLSIQDRSSALSFPEED